MLFFLQSFLAFATLFVLLGSASASLPDYDPVAEFPFFEQCDLHSSPMECSEPVGVPLSCNGVYFCCPETLSDIVEIVCDGQRFVGAPSTHLSSITVALEDDAFSEEEDTSSEEEDDASFEEEEEASSASSLPLSVGISTFMTAAFAASTILYNIF